MFSDMRKSLSDTGCGTQRTLDSNQKTCDLCKLKRKGTQGLSLAHVGKITALMKMSVTYPREATQIWRHSPQFLFCILLCCRGADGLCFLLRR